MKLIKTSFFSAIITIIRTASGFVSSKFVAIYVGPTGLALIGQFINFISVMLTFANGGITNGVVKYVAEYEGDNIKTRSVLSASLKISLFCSIAISFVTVAFSKTLSILIFQTHQYFGPIRAFGATILLYALNNMLVSILNGKKLIKQYTIVNIAGVLFGLFFTIILVFYYRIYGALYALALSQSIIFFITFYQVSKNSWFNLKFFLDKLDIKMARQLGNFSLMAIISACALPISQMFLRNVIISQFGIVSAGHWQSLMRVSDAYLLVATTALATYYLPQLSSLKKEVDLKKEIWNGYKYILPASIITSISIYLFRVPIIKLLYSSEFLPVADLFFYQLLGDFFKIASWLIAYLMLSKAMTKTYIITEIIFTLSYVGLSILCMNSFGLKGIVIAFAINYLCYLICMVILFRKILFYSFKEA